MMLERNASVRTLMSALFILSTQATPQSIGMLQTLAEIRESISGIGYILL